MSRLDRFDDLPRPLRLGAATIFLVVAALSLASWLRIGPLLQRPHPPWLGIAIGLTVTGFGAGFLILQAWRLSTQVEALPPATDPSPSRRHAPRVYVLAAFAFGLIGFAAPALGMRWTDGLPMLLFSLGAAGEGYRAYLVKRTSALPQTRSRDQIPRSGG